MSKRPLIILAGPTAVGKTALSLELAKVLGGEIISADSMQVYRRMDIGTAKIRPEEMQEIPHHLIDVCEPTEEWNVMRFVKEASLLIEEICQRGHVPILTGGTGFYIHALAYGAEFSEEETNSGLRRELEQLPSEELHVRLQALDPVSAELIHMNNRKRVIRALEYVLDTGEPISSLNQRLKKKESPYDLCYLVLDMPRERLYERIDRRVDLMMSTGLVEEVRGLREEGCHKDMVSMKGLGYKEILAYLEGECALEEAVTILKRDTRHFAKRQLTWWRGEDDAVILLKEPEETLVERALQEIRIRCKI
ncbi:MAG: tRNA (adenosine(37)-N6)-dimethylallyltransferase MiaA [Lachnospiraceae bacterium]|nr:tRNA (adenosine(37)-N6)-dimethylallyltransferase MiaA [Lachnospiraceae bacterium]